MSAQQNLGTTWSVTLNMMLMCMINSTVQYQKYCLNAARFHRSDEEKKGIQVGETRYGWKYISLNNTVSFSTLDLEPPSSPATLLPVAIGGDRGDVLNTANLHTRTSESPKGGLGTWNKHQSVQRNISTQDDSVGKQWGMGWERCHGRTTMVGRTTLMAEKSIHQECGNGTNAGATATTSSSVSSSWPKWCQVQSTSRGELVGRLVGCFRRASWG